MDKIEWGSKDPVKCIERMFVGNGPPPQKRYDRIPIKLYASQKDTKVNPQVSPIRFCNFLFRRVFSYKANRFLVDKIYQNALVWEKE